MKSTLAVFTALAASLLVAGEVTWQGGGASQRWSDGSNWVGGTPPVSGDIAVIPSNTTAYASHYTDANGGDMTTINALGGIRLDGTNAVLRLDGENDSNGIFAFAVPLSGDGRLVFENTVNNDRYMSMTGDNSSFTGSFVFTNARVVVNHQNALGTSGCPVLLAPSLGMHGIIYRKSGVYSNDIRVVTSGGATSVIKGESSGMVTNLGCVSVEGKGVINVAGMYFQTISNNVAGGKTDGAAAGALRLGNNLVIGAGGLDGLFRTYGTTVYVEGPITQCGDNYALADAESDGGNVRLVCRANHVLDGMHIKMKNGVIDLNGHDQGTIWLSTATMTSITSSAPATVQWGGAYGSNNLSTSLSIDGMASLVVAAGTNAKTLTLAGVVCTTRGALEALRGKLVVDSTSSLPKVRCLASRAENKYNTSVVAIQTSLVNGKVSLESSSEYGKFDIAEGVELAVRSFKSAGVYLKAGCVYGSQEAYDAGVISAPECVLPCLSGLGTVLVNGRDGMTISFR